MTTAPELDVKDSAEGLSRDAGFFALLFTSVGSIIGSGWMLGAFTCAQLAGPSALLGWIIGSIAMILLALVFAELGGLFPVSGGTARFPHYAFGNLAGASFGWFSWLQAVATAPIEVEAALTYTSNFVPGLTNQSNGVLTPLGYAIAVIMMGLFTGLNLYGIKRLTQANNAITTWKIVVPLLTIVALASTHFSSSNFTSHGFAPFGAHGVLASVSGGVVFSLVGFEQCVQLGGESKNPQRDIPRAVIGSMIIGAIIYFLLQVVFIGALPASSFSHGWQQLVFHGDRGPFAGISEGLGLTWLAWILYADAIVAPSGSALCYLTTTSRITFGMSVNRQVPRAFERVTPRTKAPIVGLLFAWAMGLFLFLPFPSWQSLVGIVGTATVLMYIGGPVSLGALRLQKPDLARPFRLPFAQLWSPVSFIVASWIIYWAGWNTDWKLGAAIGVGYLLMGASYVFDRTHTPEPIDWHAALWLWPYLLGMGVISALGQFGGGSKTIAANWDLVLVAAWSVAVYVLAIRLRLPEEEVDRYAADVYPVES